MTDATFLHTSDWHLGRTLAGVPLLEDQRQALARLVEVAAEVRPTAVLIAGDVFDRALPPAEAVELLDETLDRLVRDLGLTVVLIAGNHDSPERIGYARGLLARQNLHVRGTLGPDAFEPIRLRDSHGDIDVAALPFADPPTVRDRLGLAVGPDRPSGQLDTAVRPGPLETAVRPGPLETAVRAGPLDTDRAMRALLKAAADRCTAPRRLVVAHTYVAGSVASESERPLSVGTVEQVAPDAFAGWHYVALGHLHRPQEIARPAGLQCGPIRYCGSLFGYSRSEVDQVKSATLVRLDAAGQATWQEVPLTGPRRVRRVEGRLQDLVASGGRYQGAEPEDYVFATLTDERPQLDAMSQLRRAWPNALGLEQPGLQQAGGSRAATLARTEALRIDQVVEQFWTHRRDGQPMPDQERELLRGVLAQIPELLG